MVPVTSPYTSYSNKHAALKTGILDKAKTQPNPSQVDQSLRADHEDVASSDDFSTPPGEAISENETSAAQKPDQPKSNLVQLRSRLTRHKAKVEETNEKQRQSVSQMQASLKPDDTVGGQGQQDATSDDEEDRNGRKNIAKDKNGLYTKISQTSSDKSSPPGVTNSSSTTGESSSEANSLANVH